MAEEILGDVLRSKTINEAIGYPKFTWCKQFVYSNILKEEVALAGDKINIALINKTGNIIWLLDNM